MSRFSVGQRVRVARNVGDRCLDSFVGREGTIDSLGVSGGWHEGHDIRLRGIRGVLFHPADLEPVIPEGQKASQYSLIELLNRCREGVSA